MGLSAERYTGGAEEWDGFAAAQPGFTHFHRWDWKSLIEEVFGHECLYLAARGDDDRLEAVLPLVRIKSAFFGHYLVSMPFVSYGGPLGSAEGARLLAEGGVRETRESRARLLELRSRTSLPLDLPVSHRKITVVLDLPAGATEALFDSFDRKLRGRIRRPQKEGIEIRFGSDQVDAFYRVFSRHMRDLGTPTLPRRFFRAIADRFPGDAWFGCAWLGEKPVACGAGFRWGNEFEMTWSSSLSKYNHIAPNMLVYWEFMRRAIADGARLFNFGRCTPDGGTHRFKRQWGAARDEPLWWYQWARDGSNAATPSPGQGKYAWGPRVWRHLPLGFSRMLGPLIVRSIP